MAAVCSVCDPGATPRHWSGSGMPRSRKKASDISGEKCCPVWINLVRKRGFRPNSSIMGAIFMKFGRAPTMQVTDLIFVSRGCMKSPSVALKY